MSRWWKLEPKKGDRITITYGDTIVEGIIESVKKRAEWGSLERIDEPEPTHGYWYDVGISIEEKGDAST